MALMRNLGQRYVQYFNKRHDRTGTLWEGRFRSCLTESARYVLACYRYIEMNPVRAGMVTRPADYRWSSHACNTGRRSETLISPHQEFLALGNDDPKRRESYGSLFEDELDSSLLRAIRESTNSGYPLGSEGFKSSVSRTIGRRLERKKAGRPPKMGSFEEDADQQEIGL